jgi:hypothetical protein
MQPQQSPLQPDPLGDRYRAYQSAGIWIAAGFVFAAVLIVAGAFLIGFALYGAHGEQWDLPWAQKKGWSWLAVGLVLLIGGGLIFMGWEIGRSSFKSRSYAVELRTNGFRVWSGGKCEEVLWADVLLIQQITRWRRFAPLAGAGRLIASEIATTSYKAITKSGKEYEFERTIKGFDEFRKILREVAHQKAIRWEKVEERA